MSNADLNAVLETAPLTPSSRRRLQEIIDAGENYNYTVVLAEYAETLSMVTVTWVQRRPSQRLDTRLTVRIRCNRPTGRDRWSAEGEHHLRGYTLPPVRTLPTWLFIRTAVA